MNKYLALGIAIGVGVGAALGVALHNMAVSVGIGAALAYFFDPVSGAVRRQRVQNAIEDQLNKRTGLISGDGSTVQTRSVPTPPE